MSQVQQINLEGGPGIRVSRKNHLREGPQTWRPVLSHLSLPTPRLSAGSLWEGRGSPLPQQLWLDPNTEQKCSRKIVILHGYQVLLDLQSRP